MKYIVEYLSDDNVILVKIEGRMNYQLAEESSKDALKLARQNKCSKFVIDHKKTININKSTNLHTTGAEFQQFGFKKTDRIAILVNYIFGAQKSSNSDNNSAEWSKIKYFRSDNRNGAIEWLSN